MFLKKQKRTLSFLLALVLVLSTFLSVAVFPASAAGGENYSVKLPNASEEQKFAGLQDAIDYVVRNGKPEGTVITLLQNEAKTLDYNENCTIPAGVTLLIPFDENHTIYSDEQLADASTVRTDTYDRPSNFMTLDMQTGSSLTVDEGGAIVLGGKIFSSALGADSALMPGVGVEENRQSVPSGPDGRIHMNKGSRITVNGGKLYAFGYIYGEGTEEDILVEAKSGSTIYEVFQITGWRGKDATLASMNKGTFPFNQYYIQNIEVPLQINYGANEAVYSTLFGMASATITFIGDGGMFQIEDNGYLIKDYIESEDRLSIETHCDASLGGLSLTVGPVDLSTSKFPYLPLTNNISITVATGTVDVAENIALLPGSELTVNYGATVTVDKEATVFVLSKSDWALGDAMAAAEIFPVAYTTAAKDSDPFDGMPMTRVQLDVDTTTGQLIGLKGKDLANADVDINGRAEVYGGFLTTAVPVDEFDEPVYSNYSASVHSSEGTGVIKYCAVTGSDDVEFYSSGDPTHSPGSKTKSFVAAQIRTEDGYTPIDEQGYGEYSISNTDVDKKVEIYTVTWKGLNNNGNPMPLDTGYYYEGEIPVYTGSEPTHSSGYDCIGWTSVKAGTEVEIPYGHSFPAVTKDTSYFAVFNTEVDSSVFKKHSLTLEGTIGVNFYVAIPEGSIDDYTMDFTWGEKFQQNDPYVYGPESYTLNNVSSSGRISVDGTTLYQFTVPVAAKELNDTITATLKHNNAEVETEAYSGTTYAFKLLAKTDDELNTIAKDNNGAGLRALVVSMLNYCSAAQDEFDYHTGSYANDGLTAGQKSLPAVPALDVPSVDAFNGTGLTYYGASVNLGSDTAYSVYLLKESSADPSLLYSFDGSAYNAFDREKDEIASNEYAVRCTFSNIAAAKTLDDIYLKAEGKVCTVNMKTYISNVLNNSNDAVLVNIAKALYDYGTKAKAYFG